MYQAFARQTGMNRAAGAQGAQALVGDEQVNNDHVILALVEELRALWGCRGGSVSRCGRSLPRGPWVAQLLCISAFTLRA